MKEKFGKSTSILFSPQSFFTIFAKKIVKNSPFPNARQITQLWNFFEDIQL